MRRILTALVLCFLLTGCPKDNSDSVCNYDPCGVKAPAAEITALQSYLSDNGIAATQHCSGLFFNVQNPGSGPTPNVCNRIGVRYKGTLTNGNVFDEQANTFYFRLGELIPAWKNGLTQLKAGGKMRLYVPPSLGYGGREVKDQSGNVVIPANSILVFDIELVEVF